MILQSAKMCMCDHIDAMRYSCQSKVIRNILYEFPLVTQSGPAYFFFVADLAIASTV